MLNAEKKTKKEAWDTLKVTYLGTDRVKIVKVQTLKAESEVLSMKEPNLIEDFWLKINNIVSNIRALGHNGRTICSKYLSLYGQPQQDSYKLF